MFEPHKDHLLPLKQFYVRILCSITIGFLMIMVALGIGMLGYHFFENMPWIDAFVNAAMILSGMGPLGELKTFGGKLFAGLYALFSGLMFILIIAIIFAPLIHRFFHKFHMDMDSGSKGSSFKRDGT